MPIGIDHETKWECVDHSIEVGDTLFFMSGGMATALDVKDSKEPGIERICEMTMVGGDVDVIAQRLEQALDEHSDPEAVNGDRIFVLIERSF